MIDRNAIFVGRVQAIKDRKKHYIEEDENGRFRLQIDSHDCDSLVPILSRIIYVSYLRNFLPDIPSVYLQLILGVAVNAFHENIRAGSKQSLIILILVSG